MSNRGAVFTCTLNHYFYSCKVHVKTTYKYSFFLPLYNNNNNDNNNNNNNNNSNNNNNNDNDDNYYRILLFLIEYSTLVPFFPFIRHCLSKFILQVYVENIFKSFLAFYTKLTLTDEVIVERDIAGVTGVVNFPSKIRSSKIQVLE